MRRRDALRAAAGLFALTLPAAAAEPYAPLGSLPLDGAKEAVIGPDGTTAYVAVTDGFAAVDVSDPGAPRVLAERRSLLADREDGPLRGVQDVKVDGDRLLVVGPANGGPDLRAALLYDVADPAAPERLAVHETPFAIHNAFLRGGRAYLTGNDGEANPLVIMDAAAGDVLGRWSILDRDERWGEVHPGLRPIHDVWVHDGLAYCAYWDAGTWIVDVRDPAAPSFVGRVGGVDRATLAALSEDAIRESALERPGNHHYCATDAAGSVLAIGREAWNVGEDGPGPGGIDLWDVSAPATPRRLSRIAPPPTPDATRSGVWTTAHNFDLRGGRLYSSWYQGGVKLHDVRDPSRPSELAWWRSPGRARFWTAQRAATGIVATHMGTPAADARVYVFPDRPGEQVDPPSLTPSPTPTDHGSAPLTTADTPTPTDTPTPAPTETPTASPTDEPTSTPITTPGFGAAAGLAGLAALARYLRGR